MLYEVPDLIRQRNPRRSQRLRDRTTRDLSYFRNLPEAIRQMIVDIWRAGLRARSFKGWQRPAPIVLGLSHQTWLRDNTLNGVWQWFATMGPGNNAVSHARNYSYAYGGNPVHYVLSVLQANPNRYRCATPGESNLEITFGNTLTKLIEYVQPTHHYTAAVVECAGSIG